MLSVLFNNQYQESPKRPKKLLKVKYNIMTNLVIYGGAEKLMRAKEEVEIAVYKKHQGKIQECMYRHES